MLYIINNTDNNKNRYASKEMSLVWSPATKFSNWRKLWVALAEAERQLGLTNHMEPIDVDKEGGDNHAEDDAKDDDKTDHQNGDTPSSTTSASTLGDAETKMKKRKRETVDITNCGFPGDSCEKEQLMRRLSVFDEFLCILPENLTKEVFESYHHSENQIQS